MPVGAFGGTRAIMEKIAPLGPVYQAGTLSGNPVAVAAGLATLNGDPRRPASTTRCAASTRAFTEGLEAAARSAGVAFSAQSVGGMFGLYFAPQVPDTYDTVMACDKARFNRFFHAMLAAGVYLAPSAYEAGFVSSAHSVRRHRRDDPGGGRRVRGQLRRGTVRTRNRARSGLFPPGSLRVLGDAAG